MPPTLRLSVPVAHSNYELGRDDYGTPSSSSSSSEPELDYGSSSASGLDDDISSSSDNDEQSDQVRSPTRLVYNLDALPEKQKSTVREAFHEPPAMVVQHCRQVDDTFAFQMSEVVTRSVRIRAAPPASGQAPRLSCSCSQSGSNSNTDKQPCHHILWLLDQLVKQTLYDTDHEQPLTMTAAGYPEEMGDPFRAIADHHLNIVADGLHCRHVDEHCYDPRQADTHRIQESRELLSSVHRSSADAFRPDLFDEPLLGPPMVQPQDLDHTVFRMLVDDDIFFHYFLSEATRGSNVLQQFRLLTHRINAVLQDFDQHNSGVVSSDEQNSAQGSHTVAWAARHIQGVVSLVRYAVWSGERPLKAAEKAAAARTLIHILDCVLKRRADVGAGGRRPERNLFLRFLGDADTGFVLNELEMIPEGARLYVGSLEAMVNRMAEEEAMPAYVVRFRRFIAQLKASGPPPSLKRESPSDDEDEECTYKRRR